MRTFNDIVPPSRRREAESTRTTLSDNQAVRPSSSLSGFPFATLAASLLVIGTSVFALYYFSVAKVVVTPGTVGAVISSSYTANKTGSDLPYEIITAKKIATQSVKSTGVKTLNTFASGVITIYNAQPKSQTLVKNTRFASSNGLIFRIHAPITISAGSTASPASVSVKVYADKAGGAYNIPPTTFTIPGFAGTPAAKTVYAQSVTPMTGGAVGDIPSIDTAVEQQAQNALVSALTPELISSLETQVPQGYILLAGASTTTFENLTPVTGATAGMVDVKVEGTISAAIFQNAALAREIAKSLPGLAYQGEPISVQPTHTLRLQASKIPASNDSPFSFTLSGTAAMAYTIDSAKIAAAISGKTRTAAEVALSSYPEIKRAVLILRPFWRQTFPDDPSDIAVIENNP